MPNDQLTIGFRQLELRVEEVMRVVNRKADAVDDHATRLDIAWGMIVKLDRLVAKLTTEVCDNDATLKEKLKKMEEIVVEHDNAIPQLRHDFQ